MIRASTLSDSDWKLVTWEGQRLAQMQEFHALPFSEKVSIIEEMADLARESPHAEWCMNLLRSLSSSPNWECECFTD